MYEFSAWIMVVSKIAHPLKQTVFSAGDTIRDKLGFPEALEVIGPYDVIVEVTANSLENIYKTTKLMAELDTVTSTTTYVSVRQGKKKAKKRPNCCLLLGVVLKYIEPALNIILDFDEVVRADIILGPFDMVVLVNTDLGNLSQFLDKVLKVPGIVRSITLFELLRPEG